MIEQIWNFIKENYSWLIVLVIILFILIRTKIRGYFWKVRKTKEKLKFKEFISRWKKGVEGITKLQQAQSNVIGNTIVLTGILLGAITMAIVRIKNVWWWTLLSLIGALILLGMSEVNYLQVYWRVKKIEEAIKELGDIKKE